jgi:hypothetical protein
MKFTPFVLLFCTCLLAFTSCNVLRESPKFRFDEDFYKVKAPNQKEERVFVDEVDDVIRVYKLRTDNADIQLDTAENSRLEFPLQLAHDAPGRHRFRERSFDVDFLAIPFKYRPAAGDVPRQFNTYLNGAVYLGYRTDLYYLHYKRAPFGVYKRQLAHYGFSFGGFTGLGGTLINPTVTNDQLQLEYDGVVWTKGVAGIIGVDNFTIGLALGWDYLLDRHRSLWVYQQKPWIGFTFGLNLN